MPLTKEHLWPNWLRKELAIRERHEFRIEQEKDGVETRDHQFMEPPFNQQVKAVCATCNGGWMSDIEADAKPLLQPLVRAKGLRLDRGAQRTLARWSFLKACVFDEIHPQERVVPSIHRHEFYASGEVPNGAWIRIATYEAREVGHYAYQGILLAKQDTPPPTEPTVYFVTITIGALVVQVSGSVFEEWSFADLPYPPRLNVGEIWPTKAPFEFVQTNVMTHETLLAYTKALYNVVGHLTGGVPPPR
jgi:hypothetical protein